LPDAHLNLSDGVLGVPVEYIEMADTLFAEERTSHGAVESEEHQPALISVRLKSFTSTYFHVSP
jgi:hypothetical protein